MSKKIITAIFLAFLVISIFVFINNYDSQNLHEKVSLNDNKKARFTLTNFKILTYDNLKLTSSLEGNSADFYHPNKVIISGKVKAKDSIGTKKEQYLSANKTVVYFNTKGLAQMMNEEVKIVKADFFENVTIEFNKYLLITTYAKYITQTNSLSSNKMVNVFKPGAEFSSKTGFVYKLNNQKLNIIGDVNGVVYDTN